MQCPVHVTQGGGGGGGGNCHWKVDTIARLKQG